jgi:hypothetical protein
MVTDISLLNPAAVPVAVPEGPVTVSAAPELSVPLVDAQAINPAAKITARIPQMNNVLYDFIYTPLNTKIISFFLTLG